MARHPSESLPELSLPEAWSIVGEPVESITPIGHGNRSRVYRAELTDGGTRVIRLSPLGTGRAAREAWVRHRLGNDPDVPMVHATAVHGSPLEGVADVSVMSELTGEPMSEALVHAAREDAVPLWEQFGAGLGALHAQGVSGYGLLDANGGGTHPTWREAVVALTRAALNDARSSELANLCPPAVVVLSELAPSLDAVTSPRLLHGDAQTTNVQVRGGRVVAWLDFEFALGGDPLYELAFVATNVHGAEHDREETWDALRRGYERRCPWPEAVPARERGYKILHCLRGAEFLRVIGPALPADRREAAAAGLRNALSALLAG